MQTTFCCGYFNLQPDDVGLNTNMGLSRCMPLIYGILCDRLIGQMYGIVTYLHAFGEFRVKDL